MKIIGEIITGRLKYSHIQRSQDCIRIDKFLLNVQVFP